MADVRPTLRQGCKAYYDSIAGGMVKVIVLSVNKRETHDEVVARVTDRQNRLYACGSILTGSTNWFVPRKAYNPRRPGARITYYQVECNA